MIPSPFPAHESYNLISSFVYIGLSLKTQELTAIYLTIRIISTIGFRELHVVLDSLTLIATLWVIYMMRYKLQSTYMKDYDNMPLYYVVTFPSFPHYFYVIWLIILAMMLCFGRPSIHFSVFMCIDCYYLCVHGILYSWSLVSLSH